MSSHLHTFTPSPNFGMNTHSVQRPTSQHNMPTRRRTQYITLITDTRDNSSHKMSQGLNRPSRAKAHAYPETCESRKDGGQFPRTPKIPTVALPREEGGEDEEDEEFSNGGSDSESGLGGGLVGTLHGDPEAILLGCLDDIFPELCTIRS